MDPQESTPGFPMEEVQVASPSAMAIETRPAQPTTAAESGQIPNQSQALQRTQLIAQFVSSHSAFELIPTHGKLVAFDVELSVHQAVVALLENYTISAPVWDSKLQAFVDLFSTEDIIRMLLAAHQLDVQTSPGTTMHRQSLRNVQEHKDLGAFLTASVDESIFTVCRLMQRHRVHCLPLADPSAPSNLLNVLSCDHVLSYIANWMDLDVYPEVFAAPVSELGIERFGRVFSAQHTAPVASVLQLAMHEQTAAIPILDDQGQVVDIFSCKDIRFLALLCDVQHLSLPIAETLAQCSQVSTRLHQCSVHTPIRTVLHQLAHLQVHQVLCMGDNGQVQCIITAADLLQCLLLAS